MYVMKCDKWLPTIKALVHGHFLNDHLSFFKWSFKKWRINDRVNSLHFAMKERSFPLNPSRHCVSSLKYFWSRSETNFAMKAMMECFLLFLLSCHSNVRSWIVLSEQIKAWSLSSIPCSTTWSGVNKTRRQWIIWKKTTIWRSTLSLHCTTIFLL